MKHSTALRDIVQMIFLFTVSYGQEWKKIEPMFEKSGFYNMSIGIFIDTENGWFTEMFPGRTWRTTNGGHYWIMQKDSSAVWSYDINFRDQMHGWIVGKRIPDYRPLLWKTNDGGNNWHELILPEEFVALNFIDSLRGCAGGGNIFQTTDGGYSWQEATIQSDARFGVSDIYFLDSRNGWAVGEHGTITDCGIILKTTDGGETWKVNVPEATATGKGVFFTDSLHGVVVGSNPPFFEGTIMRTEDGGDNWEHQYLPCSWLNDIVFTDDSTGWTVGDYGFIWKTIDRGKTWNRIESGTTYDLNRIVFVENGNVGYIFGDKNTLLRYKAAPDKVKEKRKDNFPENFKLYPNYPNPFNGETKIEYEMHQEGHVCLRIFDLTGKEVVMLVNIWQPMGSYLMKWNGKDKFGKEVSSGIYLCHLQVGHISQRCILCLIR